MTQNPTAFTVVDPRTFDGDPFEVAGRAVAQLAAVTAIAEASVEGAKLMARNAELERQCQRDVDLDAVGWPLTAEGKKWTAIEEALAAVNSDLKLLTRVAAFNPKKPPKVIA